ncbi:spore coat CotO family protein [Aquibacillus sp. 3ASR75-11]|uniref:Spore coat CotO family protein n=1 Tax=Terrihalobacillus insolitus TaxID=2950438 RepID=A0A9X3WVR2_9BACI|nr:CotO family spore coat protein [Terrihalobacillus insolitus]MDC3425463.1 spore coat CotO family protein [Terrihalobacillus insolitus]
MRKRKKMERGPMLYITQPDLQSPKARMQYDYRTPKQKKKQASAIENEKRRRSAKQQKSKKNNEANEPVSNKQNETAENVDVQQLDDEVTEDQMTHSETENQHSETGNQDSETKNHHTEKLSDEGSGLETGEEVKQKAQNKRRPFNNMTVEEKVHYFLKIPPQLPKMKCEVITNNKSYRGVVTDYQDGLVHMRTFRSPFKVDVPIDDIENIRIIGF